MKESLNNITHVHNSLKITNTNRYGLKEKVKAQCVMKNTQFVFFFFFLFYRCTCELFMFRLKEEGFNY